LRHILANTCGVIAFTTQHHNTRSFALSALYFTHKTSQLDKILNAEKGAPCRNHNEWILRLNVCPIKGYGRFTPLLIEEKNTAFTRQCPNRVYFKFYIFQWMKRMDNPEGTIVQVLLRCSCVT